MIKASDIRKRITDGFRPFLIRTSDGREFRVPHPEFIALGSYDVAVVDHEGDINTVALMHIASIKDIRGRTKTGKHAV